MPKIIVTLSIGFPGATRTDIIDVPDDEYNKCETAKEKEELLDTYYQDWANDYIDGGFEII